MDFGLRKSREGVIVITEQKPQPGIGIGKRSVTFWCFIYGFIDVVYVVMIE